MPLGSKTWGTSGGKTPCIDHCTSSCRIATPSQHHGTGTAPLTLWPRLDAATAKTLERQGSEGTGVMERNALSSSFHSFLLQSPAGASHCLNSPDSEGKVAWIMLSAGVGLLENIAGQRGPEGGGRRPPWRITVHSLIDCLQNALPRHLFVPASLSPPPT